jgi:hypothetical protein
VRSFVLSELQTILFVMQNRLEMGAGREIRREKLIVEMRLWPRGRKVAVVCFERVTSHSTYLAEPGRNAAAKLEIE